MMQQLILAMAKGQMPQAPATPAGVMPPPLHRPGNVDLYAQPEVQNPDGSRSTVDSRSYSGLRGVPDGYEALLPSVTPDGRHLRTDEEIIEEFLRTFRHLGMFGSVEEANRYAAQLHDDYASGFYRRGR